MFGDPLVIALVALVACAYASVGHGGASGYLAVFTLLGGVLREVVPVALLLNIVVASIATVHFVRSGAFDRQLLLPFVLALVIAGALEAEIANLTEEADRLEFLGASGLTEPGVNKLVRAAYRMLNLQTFFTVGPKEIRAWTITAGMTAPLAAGVIHSDLERGFIRAEVMKYDDFIRLGSEHACREAGKLMVEGKAYVVGDGDILHIRFNV